MGLLVASWAAGGAAHAGSTADKAAAQVLFEDARALVKEGRWEEACPKFAESQKLDPAGGTLLNLANCYEHVGKTASAWILFMEAEADARTSGRAQRAEEAKRRAAELKPKLSTVQITVPTPVAGLVVKRGDEEISQAQWGVALPVDPGPYEITASAPGKKPWSESIVVKPEADQVTVSVPGLEDAPAAAGGASTSAPAAGGETPPPADQPSDGSTQWILGWVIGGVGLAGVGAGVALRLVALSKDSESKDYCLPNDVTQCTQEGVDLRDQARTLQTGSVIAWAAGGAALAAGVILLLTAPSSGDDTGADQARLQLVPSAGPDGSGVLLRGVF